jgi:hypothetical protein
MPSVFGKEGDSLYAAFFEPESQKRLAALDAWIEATTPVLQAAVAEELKSLVEFLTKDRQTEEGWKIGEAKLRRLQGNYHLIMDIGLHPLNPREAYEGELPAPAVQRPAASIANRPGYSEEGDNYGDHSHGGRTSNDDRSDSLNPNNPAHDAAIDNRSNQMNPNNPSYDSSKGHG